MDIDTVVAHFGTRYQLAKALGLRPHTPYQWAPGYLPPRYVERLKAIMAGQPDPGRPPPEPTDAPG